MRDRYASVRALIAGAAVAVLAACSQSGSDADADKTAADAAPVAAVDGERLRTADREPGAWMSHGRTYAEQRYSPLDRIDTDNVHRLGLAWSYRLDVDRGVEATPIVVDGVMYTTGPYSMVYALDPVSGELLWKYDPQVPRETGGKACCGVVNRGVAVWKGRVYVGAFDGRLIALDAADGSVLWETDTIVDRSRNYTITGAPRVVKGHVIIGNGGAELGVRGYVSAYDAETGELDWRFYTVPGDPDEPVENEILKKARDTWFGEYWKQGGGGTVWDSIAYDPELDLLYIGVGNGSPWNIDDRSEGKGDNLFLSSIVALDPDTGDYVWHYQTTPGDTWDYTATQHMILAELEIEGETRKVLMQAPKNGFFYVIDRETGELLSAENYVPVNWAEGIDPETGRPIFSEAGDFSEEAKTVTPSPFGGHNWQPMSFNPDTGLVYIPAQYSSFVYEASAVEPFLALNVWNVGVEPISLPEDPAAIDAMAESFHGALLAWDPVKQKAAWKVEHPHLWNGGTLTTAGNLVFQGNAEGEVRAYAADTGELLWSSPANTGVIAAPMTYEIDGEQYVTFMAGWGGAYTLMTGTLASRIKVQPESRVLTYKLDGEGELPPPRNKPTPVPEPPARDTDIDAEQLAQGKYLYNGLCSTCHGINAVSGGVVPDLRYLDAATHEQFADIVKGARTVRGMPSFGHVLDDTQIDLIHEYVIKRSHDLAARVRDSEGQ
ncbi:putative quinoprotein ethanol dehydrogenase [Salinisphaera sp. PC39]|uniref:PQQ-dependent dehydrogenase, methanol/ethanol family n=1 Tax=Salinisphaera sp. PC39 TaxID=1304156 RepID=UPI00334027C4